MKTWEGDRDPTKQEAFWHFGDLASPEIFKILAEMEQYLEDLQSSGHALLQGKSVSSVLRERFISDNPTQRELELFEFLMSYRWGQDNGADIDNYSASFGGADDFLFEGSEDILPHGMA